MRSAQMNSRLNWFLVMFLLVYRAFYKRVRSNSGLKILS